MSLTTKLSGIRLRIHIRGSILNNYCGIQYKRQIVLVSTLPIEDSLKNTLIKDKRLLDYEVFLVHNGGIIRHFL